MKVCTKCHTAKPEIEFSELHPAMMNGKLRPDCKACVRNRSRSQYAADPQGHKKRMAALFARTVPRARQFIMDYLASHPCIDCNETDPIVLEFDHVRGEKLDEISRLVCAGARLWRIKNEIEKCEVRCANCHRRRTAKNAGHYRSLSA